MINLMDLTASNFLRTMLRRAQDSLSVRRQSAVRLRDFIFYGDVEEFSCR